MRTRHLAVVLSVIAACSGDDGVNHLADAPVVPDAPADAAIDSPDPMVTLTTTIDGTGTGTVTSSPAGITCAGGTCTGDFDPDTIVTLTAVPGTGSVFVGWSGACTGTMPTCEVTLAQAATVTATFDLAQYAVTVTKSGAGTGTVAGGGLDCGATCTVMVDHGTMLSLTATPGNLSVFAGWGGACSGTAGCMVTVTEPTTISANFPLDTLTLFVSKGGNGAGTVTATGINCGADCEETYTAGQMVTLTAAAATGSTFTGWSGGGCSGTGTCTVTITAATTVTATFTLQQFALTVTKAGNGSGSVVSTPTGIACGTDCTEDYNYNTMVTLTATPSAGSSFSGWSGACTGTAMCVVSLTQARNVTATFTLMQFALTTTVTGNGTGTVMSSPAGITCPTDCSQSYNFGQLVTLTASPATGTSFSGWSGDCSGSTTCTVTMDAARSVTATFTLDSFTLTVAKTGTGMGTVTGTGITCGADCTEVVNFGTMVTLTPAAAMGSTFAGWSGGGCTGMGACTVTVSAATTVTATFNIQTFTLTTALAGNGVGSVTSAPAGINCGSDCTEVYNYNQMVVLTAAAGANSTFTGWSGACTGMGTCTVTMTAARSVTATFALMQFPLTVTKLGAGTGTVTSTPAGINCGTTCSQNIDYNTMVMLTAAPNTPSSTFGGWGGACTGTGACMVTMTQARTVTATFDVATYALDVTRNGTGGGTVTSAPAGINCPGTCSASFDYNTSVTLTATQDGTSNFAGWSGAGCGGTGTCVVSMTQARAVTATFNKKTFTLMITKSGDGSGTVTGNGLNCGGTCQVTLTIGTPVTLTATADTTVAKESTFIEWTGGGCSTGQCTFTINANTTIDAKFKMNPNIMFATSATYAGNLGGVAGADAKCQGLATAKGLTGTYLAYISATGLDAPSRFVNARGWIRPDGKPLVNAIGDFGTTTLANPPQVDEGGNLIPSATRPSAWTATLANTKYAGANCTAVGAPGDWSISDNQIRAMAGRIDFSDSGVLEFGTNGCGVPLHLYCFGIDRAATVP